MSVSAYFHAHTHGVPYTCTKGRCANVTSVDVFKKRCNDTWVLPCMLCHQYTAAPPPRGLTTMVDTVNIEIQSWPEVVQQALGYLQTATVLVPLFGLLW